MIVSDPEVMMGKPVVAGTRITVETIVEHLYAGGGAAAAAAAGARAADGPRRGRGPRPSAAGG
ncbi:MAG TPA: DUF433 domain-containing protein [Kofleriaceae bacterium]|nr:DUF433 domain-containing protein [Kofleriaceae bacterium]